MTTGQAELLKQNIQAKFPFLIEIDHPDYGTMRYCNADEDIQYKGARDETEQTYYRAVFTVTPPEITSTSVGNATITMSAIDQEWIQKIRGTQERATIRFIAVIQYLQGEASNHYFAIEPLFDNEFELTNASWNDISITWTMVFDDKWDINVPCNMCDSLSTPGVS